MRDEVVELGKKISEHLSHEVGLLNQIRDLNLTEEESKYLLWIIATSPVVNYLPNKDAMNKLLDEIGHLNDP